MSRIRIMYLRDTKRQPIGCVAITVDRRARKAKYQMSVVHPADTIDVITGRKMPFDTRRARLMAVERLVERPMLASIKSGATMHDITFSVMKSIANDKTAPARARKFAKSWTLMPVDVLVD